MANKNKILIVEDDVNIRNFLVALLEANDYQVVTAGSCKEAIMMFTTHVPDLTILDLGLPDMDGTFFINEIRKEWSAPVIVLSARTDEQDKVEALDTGANDYITKPFGSGELLARIRTVLRNSRRNCELGVFQGGKFSLDNLAIDYDTRRVYIDGVEIKLTQTEYNIVCVLSQQSGKILTYSAIIKAIWGSNDEGSTKKLQVNMANIRKKLGAKPGEDSYIINELGVGYRMKDKND
ncbi:MAG: response regulator transcription factor [Ruminococcaceae bacterium]|nr:response regulator transcription factor [Oscillospiraceae bacterium]